MIAHGQSDPARREGGLQRRGYMDMTDISCCMGLHGHVHGLYRTRLSEKQKGRHKGQINGRLPDVE